MGLIKAVADTYFSYISDLWEDYIYCDALDANTLVKLMNFLRPMEWLLLIGRLRIFDRKLRKYTFEQKEEY